MNFTQTLNYLYPTTIDPISSVKIFVNNSTPFDSNKIINKYVYLRNITIESFINSQTKAGYTKEEAGQNLFNRSVRLEMLTWFTYTLFFISIGDLGIKVFHAFTSWISCQITFKECLEGLGLYIKQFLFYLILISSIGEIGQLGIFQGWF